jgi:hypothetical protein
MMRYHYSAEGNYARLVVDAAEGVVPGPYMLLSQSDGVMVVL